MVARWSIVHGREECLSGVRVRKGFKSALAFPIRAKTMSFHLCFFLRCFDSSLFSLQIGHAFKVERESDSIDLRKNNVVAVQKEEAWIYRVRDIAERIAMSGEFEREVPTECPTDDGAALLHAQDSFIQEQQQLQLQQFAPNEPFAPIVTPTSELSATQENWECHDELHAHLDSDCQAESSDSMKKRSRPEANVDEASEVTGSQYPNKRQHSQRFDTFERTRFRDIIGHGAVKLRIEEMLLPMSLPPSIADSVLTGIRAQPASILLHGPPGCGKVRYFSCLFLEGVPSYSHPQLRL